MIEAELKARVRDPDSLHARLGELAAGERSVYRDVYYDHPGRDLAAAGRELRLRIIESAGGTRSVLTFKDSAVDTASGSKPEHETQVGDPLAAGVLLTGVGLEIVVAFEKHCTNYRFRDQGRDMLATVVTVPELDGTFIELETMTEPGDVKAALKDIRAIMLRLGLDSGDFTTEQYTDAVMSSRRSQNLCTLVQAVTVTGDWPMLGPRVGLEVVAVVISRGCRQVERRRWRRRRRAAR